MMNRITYRLIALTQWIRVLFYAALSSGRSKGSVSKYQPVLISGSGMVEFGKDVALGYFPSPFFLSGYIDIGARSKYSLIKNGKNTKINNNVVTISEHTNIVVGERRLIGANVEIYDSDFHGLKLNDRCVSAFAMAKPVLIGNDVFIGSNVKIPKGVTVGNGSVIANGSIVVGKIPPGVIAGGNPARVLRTIEL